MARAGRRAERRTAFPSTPPGGPRFCGKSAAPGRREAGATRTVSPTAAAPDGASTSTSPPAARPPDSRSPGRRSAARSTRPAERAGRCRRRRPATRGGPPGRPPRPGAIPSASGARSADQRTGPADSAAGWGTQTAPSPSSTPGRRARPAHEGGDEAGGRPLVEILRVAHLMEHAPRGAPRPGRRGRRPPPARG